jgi:hypothetical protein
MDAQISIFTSLWFGPSLNGGMRLRGVIPRAVALISCDWVNTRLSCL